MRKTTSLVFGLALLLTPAPAATQQAAATQPTVKHNGAIPPAAGLPVYTGAEFAAQAAIVRVGTDTPALVVSKSLMAAAQYIAETEPGDTTGPGGLPTFPQGALAGSVEAAVPPPAYAEVIYLRVVTGSPLSEAALWRYAGTGRTRRRWTVAATEKPVELPGVGGVRYVAKTTLRANAGAAPAWRMVGIGRSHSTTERAGSPLDSNEGVTIITHRYTAAVILAR